MSFFIPSDPSGSGILFHNGYHLPGRYFFIMPEIFCGLRIHLYIGYPYRITHFFFLKPQEIYS